MRTGISGEQRCGNRHRHQLPKRSGLSRCEHATGSAGQSAQRPVSCISGGSICDHHRGGLVSRTHHTYRRHLSVTGELSVTSLRKVPTVCLQQLQVICVPLGRFHRSLPFLKVEIWAESVSHTVGLLVEPDLKSCLFFSVLRSLIRLNSC